ncbi:vir protein [Legionella nautarum]|uniref:Vir protein n=1 Tax=Legionella nautarum TaxID=45070 RepID=A0A0W0WIX2_9GAMM|nr:VirB4 family type IV secretion/conjugal transfer ATPase [Legionella nautarum]KTD32195.1 vir protein [Legionella nautarum]
MSEQVRYLEKDMLAKGMTRSAKVLGVPINFVILNIGFFVVLMLIAYLSSQSVWSIFITLWSMIIVHLLMMMLSLKEDKAIQILLSNFSLCQKTPFDEVNGYSPLTSFLKKTKLKEVSSKKHLPWSHLYDKHTVVTKKGELLQILTLEGMPFHTEDDFFLDDSKKIRNRALYQMASPQIAISFYTIKKPHHDYPQGTYPEGYAKEFNRRYQEKLKTEKRYQNFIYIVLMVKAPILARTNKKRAQHKPNETHKEQQAYFSQGIKTLNEQSSRLISLFKAYGCRRLGTLQKPFAHSEVLSFLSYLVNLKDRFVNAPIQSLDNYLAYESHHFARRRGVIQIRDVSGQSRFAAMLSLKEYPEETQACLMDTLLNASCELIMTQSFFFKHNQLAIDAFERQQRKMEQTDDSVLLADKINSAVEELKAGIASCGEHHLSLCIIADELDSLNKAIYDIDAKLNQEAGLGIVREEQGVELAFWAQLPGNQAYRIRQSLISSLNLASFANLHNYPLGKASGNHWGEALTLLETLSGTPFYFNIHVGQVGNSIFIGPMGSGKTLLLSAILAFSLKFGGWRFVFDKDRGMEVITRALGGQYNQMEPGKASGMAPLQLKDSPENRAFNILLLKKILSLSKPLSTQEEKRIEKAIHAMYELNESSRRYRHLAPFLGVAEPGSLRERFDRWHSDGQHAWLFDNEKDSFTFNNKMIGFDIGKLLNQSFIEVSTPALMYLFHRISECLDASPTMVFIPEGWKALSDPFFQEQLKDWSKTPRKNNMAMLMDTQNPEDLALSPAGCSIVAEARTQVFFANAQAKWQHYNQFNVSEREFEIIKEVLPAIGGHYFLLKQGKISVVARLNLTGLNEDISILSSNLARALLLQRITARVGDLIEAWLPYYVKLNAILEQKHNNSFPDFEVHLDSYWEQCQ